MKDIFKKNQIIITALAIMIAIAGYLSFTGDSKPVDPKVITATNPDLENLDDLTVLEDGKMVATAADDEDENEETTAVTEDVADDEADDIDDVTVPVDTEDADELGDISDQDLLDTAKNVKDNGEIEMKDGEVPGEAVLASTTLNSSYFFSAKLKREQDRARIRADYMSIINNTTLSEKAKEEAIKGLLELTTNADIESAIEISLEAKGFDGVVVTIANKKVEVVVNAPSITDQQVAIIEETVKTKSGIKAENISITPVVATE